MVGPIIWIDGWVGPSRPPWRGEVEEIVSHSSPSRAALDRTASRLAQKADANLAMTGSRLGRYPSHNTLRIKRDQGSLDHFVHLEAKSASRSSSGDQVAQAIEFGHSYDAPRLTLNEGTLRPGPQPGLRILMGAVDSMPNTSFRGFGD